MSERDIGPAIFPTPKEDVSHLPQRVLGVIQVVARRRYSLKQLNILMVFNYFFKKPLPLAGIECSYFLNAYYIYILVGFFLVHGSHQADYGILHMIQNLKGEKPSAYHLR